MNEQHKQQLGFLRELVPVELTAFLKDAPEMQINGMHQYVSHLLESEAEIYDQLFESLAMMMKYVPNFILHPIIPKYIHPKIAAKITGKLTVKQVISVTGGLPVSYIGDAAVHMDSEMAAQVLAGLKRKVSQAIVDYTIQTHPLDALDIIIQSTGSVQQHAGPYYRNLKVDLGSLNDFRKESIQYLRSLG